MRTRFLFILLISTIFIYYSCGKKPRPPEAIVKVVIEDNDGYETAVPTAIVRLYSNPNGSYIDVSDQTIENPDSLVLEDTAYTDAAGFVRFQTMYDCILSVEATYTNEDDIQYKGRTILIFKQDEVYEKTLVIK